MNKIIVFSLNKRFWRYEDDIKRRAHQVLKILEKDGIALGIYLIPGEKMKLLNKRFRGKDKRTNVLSFKEPNFPHPETKARYLGEIYLAPDYIKEKSIDAANSIAKLLIHGLLHLLGYNHAKKSDRIKMERKEHFVLSQVLNSKRLGF